MKPHFKSVTDALVTAAILFTCVFLVRTHWSRPPDQPIEPPPSEPISLDGASLKGNRAAPIAIIEYSDYQCPFCKRFETDVLPTLEEKYIRTGKAFLAFRHHPLEAIHPFALRAAAAANCAGLQGNFWGMHEALFERPRQLSESAINDIATNLNLDRLRFSQCLDDERTIEAIRESAASSKRLGLTGTPAFLIGAVRPDGTVKVSTVLRGARPVGEFVAAVDRALESDTRLSATTGVLLVGAALALALTAATVGRMLVRTRRLQAGPSL